VTGIGMGIVVAVTVAIVIASGPEASSWILG
jgi:hypothetical protein